MHRFLAVILLLFATLARAAVPSGQAYDWGGPAGQIPNRANALAVLTNATLLSANSVWTLALRSDGSLFAYGNNGKGVTNTPAGTDYIHCNAGWQHGIACRQNGEVVEWGLPYDVDITTWTNLRPAGMVNNIIQVAAGDDHSAALGDDGTVYLWGGRTLVTNWNAVYTDVTQIASTWYAVGMLRADGTVTTVGENSQAGGYITPPVGLSGVTNISASQFSFYAIKNDGTLVCWGMPDTYGIMTPPANVTNVVYAGGGRDHSIALRDDGTVVVWGSDAYSQISGKPAALTNATFVASGRFNPLAIQSDPGDPDPGGGPTTYHVAKTGNDTTGTGSVSNPFLTVQKGMNTATTPGDVVSVHVGDYAEYVATAAAGTSGNPITLVAYGDGEASIRAFRAQHAYWTLDGITLWKGQNSWGQSVRIEAAAHNGVVRNCTVRDTPHLIKDDFTISGTTNSIWSPTGSDWAAAGFESGGYIRLGASSIEPYLFVNQDQNYTIASINGDVLVVNDFAAETNSAFWSVVYASPSTHTGVRGVGMISSGGLGATNITILGNTFTNVYGIGVDTVGNGPVFVQANTFDTEAWAGVRIGGNNTTVSSNLFLNNEKWLFYSQREGEDVPHPIGAGAYDFVQGYLRTEAAGTNNVIAWNWVQNVHNPLGQLAGFSTNWVWTNNVFVGVQQHLSGAGRISDQTWRKNTFYRVGFETGAAGNLHAVLMTGTGQRITNELNAYIDIGNHRSTNAEGFYTTDLTSGSQFRSNYVAGPEPTGWQGKGSFTEVDGVNGGDPLLVNPQSPLGADGRPFTEDDGLRPLPHSRLALLSIGALPSLPVPTTTPIAHLSVYPAVKGFYDATGTNFNTAWESDEPFNRTNYVRPWDTPDALGSVPCAVFADASGSISGSYSTNHWWGITNYIFDWGDGAVTHSWRPTNSHTYLWPGTYTNRIIVYNSFGNAATNSRVYRVLPQSQYSGKVYHVATNGNDGAAGTLAAPFATIAKAVSVVIAGDYIAVHPGDYGVEIDASRNVATPSSRIAIHGFGAAIGGAKFRYPNWTIHGFDIDGQESTTGAGVYVFQAADATYVENCVFHDFGGQLFGGVYSVGGGDKHPLNQNLNSTVIGCMFTNINSPNIQIFGGSNWLMSNVRAFRSIGEGDFFRPRGANHTLQDSYIFSMNSAGTGGHPDFMQLDNQAGDGFWFKDILIQRCLVEGDTNAAAGTDFALGQIETGAFADATRYSNCVVRSTIFKNVRGAFSDSNDGFKFVNCSFIGSPIESSSVTTGGGARGSSYDTRFFNTVFYGVGWTENDNVGYFYTAASGSQASNTTVFADYNFVSSFGNAGKEETAWTYNGMNANSVNGGSPGFIGFSTGDYRPSTNSPLWFAGANMTGSNYLGDNVDFLGASFPLTNTWSIGAFHNAADSTGSEPPPPAPDTTAPTPDPLTWSVVPTKVDHDSITMTATTATDSESPPVQYYFDATDGGHDSGWQSSSTYVDSALTGNTTYSYRVSARDALGNQTAWSSTLSATTDADPAPTGSTLNVTTLNAVTVN